MRPAILFLALFVVVDLCPAGQPKPRENKFMKMEVAGLEARPLPSGPGLAQNFVFVLKQPIQVTRVRVEDLTDKQPILLVDDRAPKVANNRWTGGNPPPPKHPGNSPWVDDFFNKKKYIITPPPHEKEKKTPARPPKKKKKKKKKKRKKKKKKKKKTAFRWRSWQAYTNP